MRLLFCLAFCAILVRPFAQSPAELERLQGRIDYWTDKGEQDSTTQALTQKIRCARALDSLAQWAWAWYDLSELYVENQILAPKHIAQCLSEKWREPLNAAENEPFLYLLVNRALYLAQNGSIWQAVQTYEHAARIAEQYRYADFDAVEAIYKPLGNHFTRLGDNEKAIAIFQKALSQKPGADTRAGVLNNLGIAYWNQGDFAAANRHFREALALPRLAPLKTAMLYTALARNLLDEGKPDEALRTAEHARALCAKNDLRNENWLRCQAYAQRAAGLANLHLGRYTAAAERLKEATSNTRRAFGARSREAAKAELGLGEFWLQTKAPDQAILAANAALSALLPAFLPKNAAENPAATDFYEENTLYEALHLKAAAAEQKGGLEWLKVALECHDLAWQAEMRLRQVYRYQSAKLGLQSLARARERAALRVVRALYDASHGDQSYFMKGLAIAERSRATLLLEALEENLVRQNFATNDARFAQLSTLRQSRAFFERQLLLEPESSAAPQWRTELDALVGQIAAVENDLKKAYPNLNQNNTNNTFSDIYKLLQAVADDEVLVAFFVDDTQIHVFYHQKNVSPTWVLLPYDAALKDLLAKFGNFFTDANAILNAPNDYLQMAWLICQKIAPQGLPSASKMLVMPDGPFHFVPFEALLASPPAPQGSLRNADYLIRRYTLRYAWSLATLQQQQTLNNANKHPFLGLAPMQATGLRGLAPLPEGAREWQSLPHKQVLADATATWSAFAAQAPEYEVLHLCTHAFGASGAPRIELFDRSAFLPDIYALPLHAKLVVLSACETGLGHDQSGEGVMSLARAFGQAGAAALISSLWPANDASTALIFKQFYQNTNEGKPLATALRDAKLAYLNDAQTPAMRQSPFFWAGFSVIGADFPLHENGGSRWRWGIAASLVLLLVVAFWRRKK